MKPNVTLAETKTPNGARLTLVEHDGEFCIRVNGQQLMHSAVTASELELGRLGSELHGRKKGARLLIGGLGLGFTLQSVLAGCSPLVEVQVAELMPEIVTWNRTFLRELNGKLLDDRRVKVLTQDVRALIRKAEKTPYDAIMLDIDNGTTAMVKDENHALYTQAGIEMIARALKAGGRAAVWSACPDVAIERRLQKAFSKVQAVPAKLYPTAKRAAYMIYVADKAA